MLGLAELTMPSRLGQFQLSVNLVEDEHGCHVPGELLAFTWIDWDGNVYPVPVHLAHAISHCTNPRVARMLIRDFEDEERWERAMRAAEAREPMRFFRVWAARRSWLNVIVHMVIIVGLLVLSGVCLAVA